MMNSEFEEGGLLWAQDMLFNGSTIRNGEIWFVRLDSGHIMSNASGYHEKFCALFSANAFIDGWTVDREELDFDWSVVPPWFNWVAMDADGCWCAFKSKPFVDGATWRAVNGVYVYIPDDYAPKNTEIRWKDSIYSRPGYEEKGQK